MAVPFKTIYLEIFSYERIMYSLWGEVHLRSLNLKRLPPQSRLRGDFMDL